MWMCSMLQRVDPLHETQHPGESHAEVGMGPPQARVVASSLQNDPRHIFPGLARHVERLAFVDHLRDGRVANRHLQRESAIQHHSLTSGDDAVEQGLPLGVADLYPGRPTGAYRQQGR